MTVKRRGRRWRGRLDNGEKGEELEEAGGKMRGREEKENEQ